MGARYKTSNCAGAQLGSTVSSSTPSTRAPGAARDAATIAARLDRGRAALRQHLHRSVGQVPGIAR